MSPPHRQVETVGAAVFRTGKLELRDNRPQGPAGAVPTPVPLPARRGLLATMAEGRARGQQNYRKTRF